MVSEVPYFLRSIRSKGSPKVGHEGRRFSSVAAGPSGLAKEKIMLWTIVAVFLVLWLLGLGFGVGGSLIHLLLVIALVAVVINLVSGRRAI